MNTEREVVLDVCGVNKWFGKRQILHGATFSTYTGEVFGFLGPNGAGKTTTIKLATGLLAMDEGDITICGKSIVKEFEAAMANVGGIVENPELYKYLTGMQNLRQYARMRGVLDQTRIDEVVRLVGMSNRIHDKVRKYSLGMRQRLGVAQALLHRPKLLILDEPTNGLDPAGIKDLRDVLKHLAHEEGVSVLVSSHLMSEMELMCDRVGIIVEGRLMDVKTVDELVSSVSGNQAVYRIKLNDPEHAFNLLHQLSEEQKSKTEDGLRVQLPADSAEQEISEIMETLILGGVRVSACTREEYRSLEEVFIEMTETGGDQIA